MSAPAVPATTASPAERPFVVRLEGFSGPLDLLLTLIREQEIDISDIPIARVADQFLEAIHHLGLNEAADYLEMAAYLLRIKIQMLLPRAFDAEEWEDPRAELVRRLLEYEQIREVADWLSDQASHHAERFPRGWFPEPPDQPPRPIVIDLHELLQAVERVIEALPQPVLHRVVPRPLDVEGATARVRRMLEERAEWALTELIGSSWTVADVLSVLLSVLELARLGVLRVAQRQPFGSVTIVRESSDPAH